MRSLYRLITLLAAMAVMPVAAVPAPPPYQSFAQLQHSVVANADDPLGAVRSAVQDRDGFIWLATQDGLVRFDGVAFTRPFDTQLHPYNPPFVMLLSPNGDSADMWIGHRIGGLTHIVNGMVTHYEGAGFPAGTIFALERDHDGILWAIATKGVARLIEGTWQALPPSMGWTDPHPGGFHVEKATGNIYAFDNQPKGLVLYRGADRFVPASDNEVWRAAADLPSGVTAWNVPTSSNADPQVMRDGTLWAPDARGLARVHWRGKPDDATARVDRFTTADGLSSNSIYAFLDDFEGDVWVATGAGLDRFRRPQFTPRIFPDAVTTPSMAIDVAGTLWIADAQSSPYRITQDGVIAQVSDIGAGISTMTAEPDGSVWFAGTTGIQRWKDGKVTSIQVPPALSEVQHRFLQLAHDDQGDLWTNAHTFGLYRAHGGIWQRENGRDGFPAEDPQFVTAGPDHSIWVTYPGGDIFVRKNGITRRFASVPMKVALMLALDHNDVWVGGSDGIARIRQGRVQWLRLAGAPAPLDVSGIVRGQDGSLWIASRTGVDRIRTPALAHFDSEPNEAVPTEHFDKSEGVGENFAPFFGTPSLLVDRAGDIWHASLSGISTAQPDLVSTNRVKPRVFIESVTTEHGIHPATPGLELPGLTQSLRIDYTAPMMRRPEHGRFEYMLDGVDNGWQSAGTRRTAFYTRLGPGSYSFRVRAFNEDGVRSDQDATYAFRIAPTWYQTLAFRLACVVLLVAIASWIYTLRLRAITTRMRIRHDERERIARDLHDTLLQGFQGLILRFQAVRRHVPTDPEKAIAMIDDALTRADGVMEEGRDKVASLREVEGAEADLPAAILAASDELIEQRPVAFELAVHGKPRRLKASVHEEVYRVVREAMINALHHSGGDRVEVTLEYGRRLLEVTVRDNGVGFDAGLAQERHWGVAGMHERADAIGAQLGIWSRPGSGTEVSLRVDGRRSYL